MEEESSKINLIRYKKKEILDKIKNNGKYISEETTIIKWEDDINSDTEMYIIKNNFNKIPFLGVVNYYFKREGYCVNNYQNGDQYFGYYSNDLRNKQGLYIYKPKQNINKFILRQYYFGLWENDKKDGRGIYLWLKEKSNYNFYNKSYNPFNNFETANFLAYVGEFNKDKFTNGTLLKKEGDNYFVFHGKFNSKNLQKNGKECFYYSAKLEEIFFGTYKNDVFVEGYIGKYDDNGEIENIVKFQNKKIIELGDKENVKIITKKLETFRNVIMSKDYFGILYNVFSDAIKFKNENMNNVDIFNSEKYLDLMEIAASYNQVTIYKEIEKYLNK